jgi:DGQHR domain-containing protein
MVNPTTSNASVLTARKPLKKEAFRYRQHGREFYSFVATGHEVALSAHVPEYDARTKEGYQRNPEPTRVQAAGNFVAAGGSFPTSVLVSLRTDDASVVVEEVACSIDNLYDRVVLHIPAGCKLYLVDGQHRAKGIKYAEEVLGKPMGKFGISVILMTATNELEEAKLFRTIHMEQKKMPTDLVDDLIAREVERGNEDLASLRQTDEKRFKKYLALYAARRLSDDPTSPWHGKIRPANARGEVQRLATEQGIDEDDVETGWDVSQRAVSTSIKQVVKALEGVAPEKVAEIVLNYWLAIAQVCPKAFNDTDEYPYMRGTTHGMYIMHLLFPTVWNATRFESAAMKDAFVKVLARAGITDDFWRKGGELVGVYGVAGYKLQATRLANRISMPVLPSN